MTTPYLERLRPPPAAYLALPSLALLFAAELHAGAGGPQAVLPYAVLLPGSVALLVALSRTSVTVRDGVLRVRGRALPVADISAVRPLTPAMVRALLAGGAELRVLRRPWVPTGVEVVPADGSAHWLVSSRHPEELVRALVSPAAASPDVSGMPREGRQDP